MKEMLHFEDARNYKKQIKRLYETAFPKEERAPLFFLYYKTKKENYNFYAIVDEDDFAGLIYTMEDAGMVYVFFFAIADEKRGKGYGSKVLAMMKDKYPGHTITLMIEDMQEKDADNYEQRIRRLNFYERNGFTQLHIHIKEADVRYELLGTQKGVTQKGFLQLMKNYLGGLLYHFIYKEMKIEGDL